MEKISILTRKRSPAATLLPLFLVAMIFGGALTADAREVSLDSLLRAIVETVDESVIYVPDYIRIPYPMGDVPAHTGVCTDVIVRVYRKVGIDLQREVHEDMRANFSEYPSRRIWGLRGPDRNIDHRRVPNLMAFFSRHGESFNVSEGWANYKPGDIVSWQLSSGVPHIGIISDQPVIEGRPESGYLVLHNIGGGQVLADCLFSYKITGHYRYRGKKR